MHPVHRLVVYQKSRRAVVLIYEATKGFPADERFGLRAQLRRAAVSVVANIAEGAKRQSTKDFAHFLNIAEGSAGEVVVLAEISADLGFLSAEQAQAIVDCFEELQRMLCVFRRRLLVD